MCLSIQRYCSTNAQSIFWLIEPCYIDCWVQRCVIFGVFRCVKGPMKGAGSQTRDRRAGSSTMASIIYTRIHPHKGVPDVLVEECLMSEMYRQPSGLIPMGKWGCRCGPCQQSVALPARGRLGARSQQAIMCGRRRKSRREARKD